jgi:hypothetical protein
MRKHLTPVIGLVVAAPAHALPIVSLHGGGAWHVQFASTTVDVSLLILGIVALSAIVAFRMLRRKLVQQRHSSNP